jgi:hypothetical protein
MRCCDVIDTSHTSDFVRHHYLHNTTMSQSSLSPVDLDVVRSQNKDYLYTAIAEQRNPFRGFDWGDHVICVSPPRLDSAYCPDTTKHSTRPTCIFKALLEQLAGYEIRLEYPFSRTREGMDDYYHTRNIETCQRVRASVEVNEQASHSSGRTRFWVGCHPNRNRCEQTCEESRRRGVRPAMLRDVGNTPI